MTHQAVTRGRGLRGISDMEQLLPYHGRPRSSNPYVLKVPSRVRATISVMGDHKSAPANSIVLPFSRDHEAARQC